MSNEAARRTRDELAFLPAALEIQETPPSPTGRTLMWCLVALMLAAVAWASLGHIDIVAVAPGKVIPSDRVKVIQPLATGQVRAIHVREGQVVKRGEVLIELDPTLPQAERDRLEQTLLEEQAALERQRAFAQWLLAASRGGSTLSRPQGPLGRATRGIREGLQRTLLDQEIAEHRAKLAMLDQSLARRRAELQATQTLIEKGERTLPLITARAASLAKLAEQNLVARNSSLELEQERIEAEQDLATERANLQAIQASILELTEQRNALHMQAQRETSETVEDSERKIAALRQEIVKAKAVTEQQSLTASVDGVVQQLKVHTIGGVVTPAEQLLVIVPNDQPLEIEALVLNRDIGFVVEGQTATVKVDAFPFTRYGAIDGDLVTVSKDAASDDKLGLVYPTRVRLATTRMRIDAKDVDLSAGMAVTVEIKTGHRRLIEYFLSPLIQAAGEAARER